MKYGNRKNLYDIIKEWAKGYALMVQYINGQR